MKLVSFEELFLCLLSDMYVVENHIVKELPFIIDRVYTEDLKEALKHHLTETKAQVKRLEKIFKLLQVKPQKIEWATDIKTLFSDAERFLKANPSSPLTDAAIIAIAQRIEHFEIATYGTLREFADVLDYKEIKDILKETLKEEGEADTILTKLAKGGLFTKGINVEACH